MPNEGMQVEQAHLIKSRAIQLCIDSALKGSSEVLDLSPGTIFRCPLLGQ